MGKEISHILCAGQASRFSADSPGAGLRSMLGDFSRCYHLGSIVPDTFFYAVRLPFKKGNPSRYGDILHGSEGNDTARPALEMLKALRDAPNDPLFREKTAFVCGYLTHIALDATLHPFVYHVSGNYYAGCALERREAQARHRLIEVWLDLHLLRQDLRTSAGSDYVGDIRRNAPINRELLKFFFAACEKSMPMDPSAWNYLLRGYRVQMALNSLFRKAPAEKVVKRLDGIMGGRLMSFHALFYPGGYAEIPHEIICFPSYRHPVTGEIIEGGFESIWERAVARSREFLAAANKFLFEGGGETELESDVPGYSLSSGLVGTPIGKAVYYQCIPLARLRLP